MELRSPAFASGGTIPTRFSVDGERISPPLEWSGVPEDAVELSLMLEDVNATEPRPFVHWTVYKIPADQHALPEGIKHRAELKVPARVVQGMNSMDGVGYQPPGTPFGRAHHLVFHLYALDVPMPEEPGLDVREFRRVVEAHAIAEATLAAIFVRLER